MKKCRFYNEMMAGQNSAPKVKTEPNEMKAGQNSAQKAKKEPKEMKAGQNSAQKAKKEPPEDVRRAVEILLSLQHDKSTDGLMEVVSASSSSKKQKRNEEEDHVDGKGKSN